MNSTNNLPAGFYKPEVGLPEQNFQNPSFAIRNEQWFF